MGARVQVEPSQRGGDDTAMNSICMKCSGGDKICSKKGFWGEWFTVRGEVVRLKRLIPFSQQTKKEREIGKGEEVVCAIVRY